MTRKLRLDWRALDLSASVNDVVRDALTTFVYLSESLDFTHFVRALVPPRFGVTVYPGDTHYQDKFAEFQRDPLGFYRSASEEVKTGLVDLITWKLLHPGRK